MRVNSEPRWLREMREASKTIYTVDALCGSGKTHSLCDHVADQLSSKNFLYVAPTQLLLKQTGAGLSARGLNPVCISTDTHPAHVKAALLKSLSNASYRGSVVCAAFQGFIDLPDYDWLKTDNWQVVIDEVPQLDFYHHFNVPRQKHLIAEHLMIDANINENGLVAVKPKNPDRLRAQLEKSLDDVEKVFRDFFTTVLSPNKRTFVDLENWSKVIEGPVGSDKTGKGEIRFLSLLIPKPFIGAVLMGANISQSMLQRRFERRDGCFFKPYEPIVGRLRGAHDVSSRLKISFFIPKKNVSRTRLDKITSNGTTVIHEMDLAALREFGSEPFLFIRNGKDEDDDKHKSVLDDCRQVKRIKAVSHGLNEYTHYNNIYIGASFNRYPHQFRMLKCLGLEADDVHAGYYHDLVYQAVMRTSLRDPNSSRIVHAIIPDELAAQAVATITGVTQLSRIEIDLNHREPLTQKQRNQSHAAQRQLETLFQDSVRKPLDTKGNSNDSWSGPAHPEMPPSGRLLPSVETVDESGGRSEDECSGGAEWGGCVTLHKTTAPTFSSDLHMWSFSIPKFVSGLKTLSMKIVDEKEDLFLFNASTFNLPELKIPGNFKTYRFFREAAFCVLDIDGGKMSIEDAVRIYWTEAEVRRSFLIYRTHSATPLKPNYCRIVFFCAKPIKTLEQYLAVYGELVEQMRVAGFTEADAVVDKQSKSPVQSWYLPGRSRTYPELRYCEAFGTRKRELARYAIDPEECLRKRSNILQFDEEFDCAPSERLNSWVQESERRLALLSELREGRHEAVFRAVQALKFSGSTDAEIRIRLSQATHSDHRMLKKIEDAIKSVNKPWRGRARMASLRVSRTATGNCA